MKYTLRRAQRAITLLLIIYDNILFNYKLVIVEFFDYTHDIGQRPIKNSTIYNYNI